MRILDTNHLSELHRKSAIGLRLQARLVAEQPDAYITVISAEEAMRGWLALIRGAREGEAMIEAYREFAACLDSLNGWVVLAWDTDADTQFRRLKAMKIRISTLDLRIASIALAYDATLLTRNVAHFAQVPGLKIENWLD